MIPQSNISRLSNRLFKDNDGRRIPENVLERDYCIAWFLVGLSRTSLRSKLAFKGGTALRRCYFEDYRFSEDLDFTLLEELSFEDIKKELEAVYAEVRKASNITFRYSRPDATTHRNSHTFYLAYEGPLPTTSVTKEIKVDITIKEKIVNPLEEVSVLKSYEEYSDLPLNAKILVYPLAEVVIEKTVALHDRARTEPRDLYDLWFLTVETNRVNLNDCLEGIDQKLAHRGKSRSEVTQEFDRKEARLKSNWATRLSPQMVSLPEFDGIYRGVRRVLRQAKITI